MRYRYKGISFIELLIVIAVLSLLLLLGLGVMRYQQERQVKLYAETLYHDLKWAREEAIVLNVPIVIAPFLNGQMTNHWCDGWLMYRDEDEMSAGMVSTYLKIQKGISSCEITFSSFPNRTYFRFLPQGMSDYQNGTFSFYFNHELESEIIISKAGRVRYEP